MYNLGKIINIAFFKLHFAELFFADHKEAELTDTPGDRAAARPGTAACRQCVGGGCLVGPGEGSWVSTAAGNAAQRPAPPRFLDLTRETRKPISGTGGMHARGRPTDRPCPVTPAPTSSSEGHLVRGLGQPPPKSSWRRTRPSCTSRPGRGHADVGPGRPRHEAGTRRDRPIRHPLESTEPEAHTVRPGRAGRYPPLLWPSSPKHGQRHQRSEHKTASRGRKQDQSPPGPTSRRRQGWPRRRRPGAASGAWEALGARLRGTRPPARCALSGRAEGTGCAEAPPPFPGETAWATGTLQAASGLAFSGSESLQVHPLTLTPTAWQPSRLSSHGAENKAAEGGESLPRKAARAPGGCLGGSATPARRLQDKSPRPTRSIA